MGPGFSIRLGPFPVRIEYAFFIVVGLIGVLGDPRPAAIAIWTGLAFISVLVHEFGHALAWRAYGKPASIRLMAMGGLTTGDTLTPGRMLAVAAAGPATGVVTGMAVLLAAGFPHDVVPLASTAIRDAVWINLGWAIFNLLPSLPLDGGNILANAITLITGRRNDRLVGQISIVVIGVAVLYCLRIRQPFLAVFLAFPLLNNLRTVRGPAEPDRVNPLRRGLDALSAGRIDQVRSAANLALAASKDNPAVRNAAIELLAWSEVAERQFEPAERRLHTIPDGTVDGSLLRSVLDLASGATTSADAFGQALLTCTEPSLLGIATSVALEHADIFAIGTAIDRLPEPRARRALSAFEVGLHAAGFYDVAADVGDHLFGLTDDPQTAWNAACSYAQAGNNTMAVMLLRAALARGMDPRRLEREPQLAALRGLPEFEQLRPA